MKGYNFLLLLLLLFSVNKPIGQIILGKQLRKFEKLWCLYKNSESKSFGVYKKIKNL